MTAILYPLASTPDEALAAPKGRAAREREAEALAGEGVVFVSGFAGPAYATEAAALDAFAGRVEDERPGRRFQPDLSDRFCRLVEIAETRAPAPVRPAMAEGRRWPEPPAPPRTVWRLSVSYWRPLSALPDAADQQQARKARKSRAATAEPDALRALTRQPLRPVRPQQPLDIGLFETRLPEAPHIVVPDE